MRLYIKVTTDEFQLPVAVADTMRELALMCHTTENNIYSCISKAKKRGYESQYKIVEVEEDT